MPEVSEFPWCVTRMFCSFENSPPSLPRTQTRSSCLGMGHLTSVLPGGAHARERKVTRGQGRSPSCPSSSCWMPQKADIHGARTAFLAGFLALCERSQWSPLLRPEGASLPRLEILLYPWVFWKQTVHWENSCFVNIGSLCSLALQSLLCIKHLRTEVLNNIFIFPVDVSSLFWDNSWVLVLLSSSDCTFPFLSGKDAMGPWWGERVPAPGTFLSELLSLASGPASVTVGLPVVRAKAPSLLAWPWAGRLS